MAEREKQFDESLELKVSDRLSADLNALFRPDMAVPPEIDLAVMDKMRRHMLWRRPRRILGWAASAAAVAAVVVFVLTLDLTKQPAVRDFARGPVRRELTEEPAMDELTYKLPTDASGNKAAVFSARSALASVRADIDQNGRVDILDAFKLARHVESVDRPEMKWDINRDGLVNRNDVDSIALVAVCLDKGVLR